MNFRVFDSPGAVAESAADWLVRLATGGHGRVVVSLSGGATPRATCECLGSGERWEALAQREIVWVTGDERCVPADHPESSSGMIRTALFAKGIPSRHQFLRFRTELQDARTIAAAFEEEWRALRIGGLDAALLGVGEDGHTASLFAGSEILDIDDRIAAATWVERLDAWRVSLTLPVLRGAGARVAVAAGATRRDAIERSKKGEDLPIVRVCGDAPECWWFVDREAYGA